MFQGCCVAGSSTDKDLASEELARIASDLPIVGKPAGGKDSGEGALYIITLKKTLGTKLGIGVDHVQFVAEDQYRRVLQQPAVNRDTLPIVLVDGGLVAEWNATADLNHQVQPGHVIIDVNGTRGNAFGLLEKIRDDQELRMIIWKASSWI
mmetsp:Transcript_23712/g.53451  ORF Transcript_23712/g.53451 Transcript_23712/m.53451 type:complete len:151 (+) Transcript_23712:85-537(+)